MAFPDNGAWIVLSYSLPPPFMDADSAFTREQLTSPFCVNDTLTQVSYIGASPLLVITKKIAQVVILSSPLK